MKWNRGSSYNSIKLRNNSSYWNIHILIQVFDYATLLHVMGRKHFPQRILNLKLNFSTLTAHSLSSFLFSARWGTSGTLSLCILLQEVNAEHSDSGRKLVSLATQAPVAVLVINPGKINDRRLGKYSVKLNHLGSTNHCNSLQDSSSSTTNTVAKLANSLSLFTHLLKKIAFTVLFIDVPFYHFREFVLIFTLFSRASGYVTSWQLFLGNDC